MSMVGRGGKFIIASLPAVVFMAATLLTPLHGSRGEPTEALQRLQRMLEENREKAGQIKQQRFTLARQRTRVGLELIEAGRTVQDLEESLTRLEARLGALAAREHSLSEGLDRQKGNITASLMALQRMAMVPTSALITRDLPAEEIARSAMLLSAALPAQRRRAESLGARLTELAKVRTTLTARREEILAIRRHLAEERQRLTGLLAEKRALEEELADEQATLQEEIARAAEEAESLQDLMRRIVEKTSKEPPDSETLPNKETPAGKSDARSSGESQLAAVPRSPEQVPLDRPAYVREFGARAQSIVMPARGRLTGRFGESSADGAPQKGLTIATRPGAQVIAPFDGQVVYAGTFRRYGRILIIDHGARYHSLLAGVDRISAVVGQWVLAGEPVAAMANTESRTPHLYMEMRRAGKPVNPMPWLATTESKVQG